VQNSTRIFFKQLKEETEEPADTGSAVNVCCVLCVRLRSLSHGGASGSKSGSQGLAPSASRRPKPACLNYSRDEMLTVYESCVESLALPDSLRELPDIAVEKCQPPLASVPPSAEEQVAT